jgi:hypothetical protein
MWDSQQAWVKLREHCLRLDPSGIQHARFAATLLTNTGVITLSPISTGISVGLAIMGLRGLWKLQHRLDWRGYLLQATTILAGCIFMAIGFPRRPNRIALALFDSGVILVTALFLFPDFAYYSLRFYDRCRARHRDEAAQQ